MSVPQNIIDDLTALDAALTTQQAGQASITAATVAVTTDQATLATAQAANQVNQQATATANNQLESDIAAWVATGAAPPATVQMLKKLKR